MKKQILLLSLFIQINCIYSQDYWKSLGGPYGSNIMGIVSLEVKDKIVFAGTQGDGIYKKNDENILWIKAIDGPPQPWDILTDIHGNIFVASTWGVYKSIDNGESWKQVFSFNGYLWDIEIKNNGDIYVGGDNHQLYCSKDNGATWKYIPNNLNLYPIRAIGFDNYNNIYVGGWSNSNYLYKSGDDGLTWEEIGKPSVLTGSIINIFNSSSGEIYISSSSGLFKLHSDGNIIKLCSTTIENRITLGPQNIFYKFNQNEGFYKSQDGISWYLVTNQLKEKNVLSMKFDSNGYLYIGCTNDTIYKSINSVKNDCNYPDTYPFSDSPFCPLNEDKCPENTIDPWNFYYRECTSYVAFKINEGVRAQTSPYFFTNNMLGGHWGNAGHWAKNAISVGYTIDNIPTLGSIAQWDTGELGNDGHVAFVEGINADGSVNLSEYNYHLDHNYNIRCNVKNIPRFIHVKFLTSIRDGNNKLLPSFILLQNYPNPFNSSTKISFSIPQKCFVTLKVYNILGENIATIVNEEKSIGNYEVEFNAKNLPSGVYFYKMQAGIDIAFKKFILLK